MKRLPLVATILVSLAIAAMIGLGVWQLQRKQQKEALLDRYAANRTLPPVAFPRLPIGDALLFRRAFARCREPISWSTRNGRNANGGSGWRQIGHCAGNAGPGLTVQMGLAHTPGAKPSWRGGEVRGYITQAPSDQPLIASLVGRAPPKTLMLVADTPAPGLDANPAPDLASVPNNHLAYAVQWFAFAAVAALIYALALRRRMLVTPGASR